MRPIGQDLSAAVDITLVPVSETRAANVNWLVQNVLATKKITLLAGTPGAGKTTIALYYAAKISSGGQLADGNFVRRGRVLIYTTEDGISDTIKPRLVAMGADVSNVVALDSTTEVSGRRRGFDCERDLALLERKLMAAGDFALVIIDPVTGITSGNSNNNANVRRTMEALVRFADKVNCAILCLTHVSKGASRKPPLERVMGAFSYGAVPRVVLIAAKVNVPSADGLEHGVVVSGKQSNASGDGGTGYRIQPIELSIDGQQIRTTCIEWSPELLEGTADEILKAAAGEEGRTPGGAVGVAMKFLEHLLAHEPMCCADVENQAREAGIAARTIVRARKALGVQCVRGPDGRSILSLPVVRPNLPESGGRIQSGMPLGSSWPLGDRWGYGFSMPSPPSGASLPNLVGTVGTVGTVGEDASALTSGKPDGIAIDAWAWATRGYQEEFRGTKRRDGEDEFQYRDRVARQFVDASCSEWEQPDALARALSDALNRHQPPYDSNAF